MKCLTITCKLDRKCGCPRPSNKRVERISELMVGRLRVWILRDISVEQFRVEWFNAMVQDSKGTGGNSNIKVKIYFLINKL